ncbi:hypothetical protein G3545_08425 [Starkeya sp. ORNL1]|uniref:hypothetical protein n=1 Tax=Starkeya sp. ORNL1 TaxID=2709380 RepID=UPI001463B667|nr:hypothetical protein [Starkeya sp. ORNL1]QJP13678.1 hypothetical protein G3545_08425 [Starkeya sp. ORNL1]
MWTGNLPPASNREAWSETVSYRPTDASPAPVPDEIVVAIAAPKAFPGAPAGSCLLAKRLSAGEIVNDAAAASFTFVFSAEEMRRLRPGSHSVGMVLTLAGAPVQLFTGSIEILDGIIP